MDMQTLLLQTLSPKGPRKFENHSKLEFQWWLYIKIESKLSTCSEEARVRYLDRMPAPKAFMSSPSRKTPNSMVYLQT